MLIELIEPDIGPTGKPNSLGAWSPENSICSMRISSDIDFTPNDPIDPLNDNAPFTGFAETVMSTSPQRAVAPSCSKLPGPRT